MSREAVEAKNPEYSVEAASQLVEELFGKAGKLKQLVSDRDQNFRVVTPSESFVLKISNTDEDISFLDFQNKALGHLALMMPNLPITRLICSRNGKEIETVELNGQKHHVRLLSYVEGKLFSEVEKSPELFASLGTYIGRLTNGLQGFGHAAAHRPDFIWNLDNVLVCEPYVAAIVDTKNKKIVEDYFSRYRAYVEPNIARLKSSVIHGDINDNNIIVSDAGDAVSSVIDFGDMAFSSRINELAIALAYALMDQDNILSVSRQIIYSYSLECPLDEIEADLLFDLVAMRLVASVCISSHRAMTNSDNEYLFISQAPGFALLQKLHAYDRRDLINHARACCGLSPLETSFDDLPDMIEHRKSVLGPSLSLAYQKHLKMVRGEGAYLYDHQDQKYLDCVNNITHVGHCHPHVVQALSRQAGQLNTNTRYLHDTIQVYAERLLATMPDPLSVVFFVCSGSEANELALRMARTKTGRKGVVVLDWAYHGNTSSMIEISPYKFNRKGGTGRPDHVRIADIPDPYRGVHRGKGDDVARAYAESVREAVEELRGDLGEDPAAFIAESIAGVGGQVFYPDGYLERAYEIARDAEALCIADEVQVGFGRVGTHMWAFEQQGVVPDIVTLGKPIGNGHPMAAVVTTREIADAFANGMEYFNSFGGNPVSCAVGMAVMDVIENESLQQHALKTGAYLLAGLEALAIKYSLIGDVRGSGLFLGVELVKDQQTLEPATEEANTIVQYCRDAGVLLSTDGPYENVIKMKPPMVFGRLEADLLLNTLDRAFIAVQNS